MKSSRALFTNITILLVVTILASCSFFGKKDDENNNTAEAVMQRGDLLFEQGKYQEALTVYQSLLVDFPTSDLHIDDQLRIANTYGKMDNFEKQMEVLLQLLKENIIPDRVPEVYCQIGQFYERAAMFNSGMVTSDTMDHQESLSYYKKAYEYIDSEDQLSKSKALYRAALVNAKLGNYQEATNHYNLVISNYPDSPYSILSKMKLKSITNTSELSLSESSMSSYREILGLQVPSDGEVTPQETEQPENEDIFNQNKSNMLDNTENTIIEDSNEGDETPTDNQIETSEDNQQEEPVVETPEETQQEEPAVETPQENSEESATETPQEEPTENTEVSGDSTATN